MLGYNVMCYETATRLDGTPDGTLVEESQARDTGAVAAYEEKGVWHFVPEAAREDYRRLGYTVRTVYVD